MTPRWTEATVRYADAAEHLHVREIITWDRGDIPHPIMSASSGPKAYLRNDIYEVFQISPHVGAHVVVDCESHDIIRRCRSGLEATQGKLFIEVPGVAEVTVST